MTNNPYEPRANTYGNGGNPYGGPQQNPPSGGGQPVTRAPFVDPYQPRDNQPIYPPAVTRAELAQMQAGGPGGGPTTRVVGATASGASPLAGEGRRRGAVACLLIVTILVASGVGAVGLGVAAIFYAVARSEFTRAWARSCFNFLITYVVVTIVVMLVAGILGVGGAHNLAQTLRTAVHWMFVLVFVVGILAALSRRVFSFPAAVSVLK